MLSGQAINFLDTIQVAAVGIIIVMAALGMLAIFVTIMSKAIAPFAKSKEKEVAPKSAPTPSAMTAEQSGEEEIYAAILAAVSEESGLSPTEFIVKSIQEM